MNILSRDFKDFLLKFFILKKTLKSTPRITSILGTHLENRSKEFVIKKKSIRLMI